MTNEGAEKVAMPSRERYWEEATTEDKVERLLETVSKLCRIVQQQAQIMVKYGIHTHMPDGKLVVGLADSMEHQVSARVDRLKGLGNAVVPQIPEIIGRAIMKAEAQCE